MRHEGTKARRHEGTAPGFTLVEVIIVIAVLAVITALGPLSMQIIGKPFDEATVYRVARAYERVRSITWKDAYCRSDIGYRAVARERA